VSGRKTTAEKEKIEGGLPLDSVRIRRGGVGVWGGGVGVGGGGGWGLGWVGGEREGGGCPDREKARIR